MRQVTLEISDDLWEFASDVANRDQRGLEQILTEMLVRMFSAEKLANQAVTDADAIRNLDLSGLSDEQLLVHIEAKAAPQVQERLSYLQAANREGEISMAEVAEFDRLLRGIQVSTLLKAKALSTWKSRHGKLPPGFESLLSN